MAANGFEWKYNVGGGRPLILTLLMKDTETLTRGDKLNVESREVELCSTGDAAIAETNVAIVDAYINDS